MTRRNIEIHDYFINHTELSLYALRIYDLLLYELIDVMYSIVESHSTTRRVGIII